jgi:hypothetical protein
MLLYGWMTVTLNVNAEPPVQAGDTQPRRPVVMPEEERRGCANPLLVLIVALMLIGIFVSMIALAAFAGYRDGGVIRRTQNAVALFGTLDGQATLAWQDLATEHYELADARCKYLIEIKPEYPGMRNCISTAQAAMNATPTFTPTMQPTETPIPTAEVVLTTPSALTPETLLARADSQISNSDYEAARKTLEALRGLDISFRRQEVEDKLVNVYLTLAQKYEFEGRLGELVNVVSQAELIRDLSSNPNTQKWPITKDAANLYISAKSYAAAQNMPMAVQVYRLMMTRGYNNFLDTRKLACDTFTAGGDTSAYQQFCTG